MIIYEKKNVKDVKEGALFLPNSQKKRPPGPENKSSRENLVPSVTAVVM